MSSEQKDLSATLLSIHGPVMGGAALRRALGYQSYAAFRLARAKGELGVRVFHLPKRRGVFGLTTEVAAWLVLHAEQGVFEVFTSTTDGPNAARKI